MGTRASSGYSKIMLKANWRCGWQRLSVARRPLGRKSDFATSKDNVMSPFYMVISKPDGEEIMHWEITSIEKLTLEDSLFLPPPDYKKILRDCEKF